MKVLFIGGTIDGQKRDVKELIPRANIARPCAEKFNVIVDTYVLERIRVSNKDFHVYRYQYLNIVDMFIKLINNYTPASSVAN